MYFTKGKRSCFQCTGIFILLMNTRRGFSFNIETPDRRYRILKVNKDGRNLHKKIQDIFPIVP